MTEDALRALTEHGTRGDWFVLALVIESAPQRRQRAQQPQPQQRGTRP